MSRHQFPKTLKEGRSGRPSAPVMVRECICRIRLRVRHLHRILKLGSELPRGQKIVVQAQRNAEPPSRVDTIGQPLSPDHSLPFSWLGSSYVTIPRESFECDTSVWHSTGGQSIMAITPVLRTQRHEGRFLGNAGAVRAESLLTIQTGVRQKRLGDKGP